MTNREAIEILKENSLCEESHIETATEIPCSKEEWDYMVKWNQTLRLSIQAIAYRDPQEVKRKGSSYYCPRCNNNLSSAVYIENKCCHECGQKLYWRPVDETKT